MEEILYRYDAPSLTTWVYLSSLLTIAIFFKFSRWWSVRNLDLIALIALGPGLLLVDYGENHDAGSISRAGYIWLFVVGGLWLVRLLVDNSMVRRPLLEPNLSPGGLTFAGAALFLFLMANVVTKDVAQEDLATAQQADELLSATGEGAPEATLAKHGPGYPLLWLLPAISTKSLAASENEAHDARSLAASETLAYATTARTMAILSHFAVVLGMLVIGRWHFDNLRTGIAAAVLYLILPYTAQSTGRVDHVLPAALLVWGVVAYRSPLVSGVLLGLATGAIYYPLFLLPLWLSFYWQRGLARFTMAYFVTLAILVASLAFTPASLGSFFEQLLQMFGWTNLTLAEAEGFWSFTASAFPYRLSVFTVFALMCAGFALWPAQKNLGTLLSCSAAVMLGTQFWHAQGGGVHMAWYLPLLLLTVFRPNLDDRVALTTLGEGWLSKKRVLLRNWAA